MSKTVLAKRSEMPVFCLVAPGFPKITDKLVTPRERHRTKIARVCYEHAHQPPGAGPCHVIWLAAPRGAVGIYVPLCIIFWSYLTITIASGALLSPLYDKGHSIFGVSVLGRSFFGILDSGSVSPQRLKKEWEGEKVIKINPQKRARTLPFVLTR
jgi:hypothetical protein